MIGSLNKCENTKSQQQKAKRKHLGVLMKRIEGENAEKKRKKYRFVKAFDIMDYDETSLEVTAAIAMIKSMTTTSRRRPSQVSKSPMLPQINRNKRGIISNDEPAKTNKTDSSRLQWAVTARSTRGVTLASIEFKRRLEEKRTKRESDFKLKASRTKRPSICKQTENAKINDKEIPLLNSGFSQHTAADFSGIKKPRKCLKNMREKVRKRGQDEEAKFKAEHTRTKENHLMSPLISVMKITPQSRPSFHVKAKAYDLK